jgi:hypothetical protein
MDILVDVLHQLRGICCYAGEHFRVAVAGWSSSMTTGQFCEILGRRLVWLYCLAQTMGKSLSWECSHKMITWINNMVCWTQWHVWVKMMVGTGQPVTVCGAPQNKQHEGGSSVTNLQSENVCPDDTLMQWCQYAVCTILWELLPDSKFHHQMCSFLGRVEHSRTLLITYRTVKCLLLGCGI